MSWRIQVEHGSTYHYGGEVQSSYNEARVTPLTTPDQTVLDTSVVTLPSTRAYRYLDYWGSVVHAFDLHVPHTDLVVTARSLVDTSTPPAPHRRLGWEQLADPDVLDDYAEVLAPTVSVPLDPRLVEVGRRFRDGRDPLAAVTAAVGWVAGELTYTTGSTGVHTSAVEAWEGGRGVCQDFAHLALAVIRSMGVPARYCSGYLHPNADAGMGVTVEGESHAWIEWWDGDWQAVDPTIGWPTGERHVLVARGRDYTDVSPLRGIFHGGPTAALDVRVSLTRVG